MEKFITELLSDDGIYTLLFFAVLMMSFAIGGTISDWLENRKARHNPRSMATPRRH